MAWRVLISGSNRDRYLHAPSAPEAPAEWTDTEGVRHISEANAELHKIAGALAGVQRRNFYQVQASIGHGRHWHLDIDVERADDHTIGQGDCETVAECLRDFAAWLHSQLEREWEYQLSDDSIDENIRSNEYEFDEDGNLA